MFRKRSQERVRFHWRRFGFGCLYVHGFHFPASLGSTVITRFLATTDALTASGRFFDSAGSMNALLFRVGSSLLSSSSLRAIRSPNMFGVPSAVSVVLFFFRTKGWAVRHGPMEAVWFIHQRGFRLRTSRFSCTLVPTAHRIEFTVWLLFEPRCDRLAVRFQLLSTDGFHHRSYFPLQAFGLLPDEDLHLAAPMPSQSHMNQAVGLKAKQPFTNYNCSA